MEGLQKEIIEVFGNRLRVRSSGILIQENKVLLIRHTSLGEKGIFWSPPGGGVNFGETVEDSLKREFIEETGLEVAIGKFLFVNEYLEVPLHAIELFFLVRQTGGTLRMGTDPELKTKKQIIQELAFLTIEEIKSQPAALFHGIFSKIDKISDLENLQGYFH